MAKFIYLVHQPDTKALVVAHNPEHVREIFQNKAINNIEKIGVVTGDVDNDINTGIYIEDYRRGSI